METAKTIIIESPAMELESETESVDGNALWIPDGGWGWVVCFAGFMISFTAGGLNISNGILLLGLIDLYDDTISKTAMVASIFGGIMLCVGPFVLLLMMFNASHRQIIICGGFFSALATIGSFFAEKVEVLYVTHGILSGCFVGISYIAASTIVGSYFKKKRTLAVGISLSGIGFGGFFLNFFLEQSISFYGMRGTFLLISGLLLNFVIYGALCRPLQTVNMKNKVMKKVKYYHSVNEFLLKPESGFHPDEKAIEYRGPTNIKNSNEHRGHSENKPPTNMSNNISSKLNHLRLTIFDPGVMKNPSMQLLLTVYFFWTAGECVSIYLPAKAVDTGLTREEAALVMSIYGGIIAPSQIIVGILADLFHIPISYLLMSSLIGMTIFSLVFTFCQSFSMFVACASVFAIFQGFTYPLRIVLVSSVLGVKNLTKGYSPLCLLIGLTYIIITKITGSLVDATQSFDIIFYFISVSLFISCIISIGIIYMQRKRKFYE